MSAAKIETRKLNLWYDEFHALIDVDIAVRARAITSIIGPSGCGKSTLLKVFNRMTDLVPSVRIEGGVMLDGVGIFDRALPPTQLRKRVGMVFQRPNPFPLSVYENVAYGPKIHGLGTSGELAGRVQRSMEQTGLWDGLKDKLSENALKLSPEQQQRLCISRLLAVEPEVLLMDEPCSALDPIATARIEDLLRELKVHYTIIIVTHNMQQAARVSDETAYMLLGELIEFGETQKLFATPTDRRTEEYISGRFG